MYRMLFAVVDVFHWLLIPPVVNMIVYSRYTLLLLLPSISDVIVSYRSWVISMSSCVIIPISLVSLISLDSKSHDKIRYLFFRSAVLWQVFCIVCFPSLVSFFCGLAVPFPSAMYWIGCSRSFIRRFIRNDSPSSVIRLCFRISTVYWWNIVVIVVVNVYSPCMFVFIIFSPLWFDYLWLCRV